MRVQGSTVDRWYVLAGAAVIMFLVGLQNVWSVFVLPLNHEMGWDVGLIAMVGSIMLASFAIGSILGGYTQPKAGPLKTCLLGSAMFGSGVLLSAFTESPYALMVTHGLCTGLGAGTVYMSTLYTTMAWFPDRMGLATGIMSGCMGLSLIALAPGISALLGRVGASTSFMLIGIALLGSMLPISLLTMKLPADNWLSRGFRKADATGTGVRQYTPSDALRTRPFWMFMGAKFFSLPAYLILIPLLTVYAVTIKGLDAETAVLGVTLFGVGGMLGCLIMSPAQDRFGIKNVYALSCIAMIVAIIGLLPAEGIIVILLYPLLAFGFNGMGFCYPTMVAKMFGIRYSGAILGLTNLAFMAGNLIYPRMAAASFSLTGSYAAAFIFSAISIAVALTLFTLMKEKHLDDWHVEEGRTVAATDGGL